MTKPWENGTLRVDQTGHYLKNGDTPFFWLGDTAWDLLQRLTLPQARVYLKNRADKGFNVIQAVLTNARREGDSLGSLQLMEEVDILRCIGPENEPYWQHVEGVLDIAEELGVYIGCLPIWGKVARRGFIDEKTAEPYANFLAERFGKRKNIIWILGGDIRGSEFHQMWEVMGKILKEKTPDKLIAYHPFGRTCSSYWFLDSPWLDINMFQSGHRRYDQPDLRSWDDKEGGEPWYGEDNWRYVQAELEEIAGGAPARPVLDGEPSYEQIPQGLHDPSQPYWQEYHVRRYAWWSVLAGSCGHTYGDNSVFQFYGTGHIQEFGAVDPWEKAIHHTGSGQMQILKNLMLEIDFQRCRPMEEAVLSGNGEKEQRVSAFGGGEYLVLYSYLGKSMTVKSDMGLADGWWLDPAVGSRSYFGRVDLSKEGGEILTPPVKKQGHNDWVCLLKKV